MSKGEYFGSLLDEIINKLVANHKIVFNEHKNMYMLKTNIDAIIRNYDCQELLDMCVSKHELKYCIVYHDNPFNHYCPICKKRILFDRYKYDKTCKSKECLCTILLNNKSLSDKHQYIINEYLNGDKEFNNIQIGFIEKYGVWMNSQLDVWKTSLKETWNNKTEEELRIKKEKTINTCQKKYGCDFPQQNEDIKNKQRNTWKHKTKEEREHKNNARKNTTLKRYGVDHVMKSSEIIHNVKQKNLEKFGVYNWFPIELHHKDIFLNDTKFKEYIIDKYNENNKKRLRKKDINEYFNTNCIFKLKELHLMKYVQQHESKLENKFKELFNTHNIEYDWRNRSIIDGPNGKSHCYELDFYLPKYKIGIEINDIGTHNMNTLINSYYGKKYHVYKTNACKEKDIRLIHIWEWEIHKNFDKISTWLLNILNTDKTIVYGRKCQIKIVNVDEEKYFLNMYHLQGYTKSSICLGLYFNDELLEIMSFTKPRFTKKYEYELVRLCTKYNYSIIGGTEKLFNYFIKNYDPISIISYCDYSKFSGNIYQKIGMDFNKLSNPTIIYCNYDMNVINESILNKYGIDNLLGTHYGLHTNNKELIIKEGYLPIPNCGNLIYTYKKHNS